MMQSIACPIGMAVSLFFCFGCQSSETSKQDGIPRIAISEEHILPFDQVATEVRFISLRPPENPSQNLASMIYHLFISDKIYYATNWYERTAVHIFDLDGNHINSLEKKGDGPAEYQLIQGIYIDDEVLSISSGQGVIKQYSLSDLTYIKEFTLGKSFLLSNFYPLDASSWLISVEFTGELDENGTFPVFMKVNSENGALSPLPIKASSVNAKLGEGSIAPFDNQFLLNYGLSDTLFTYDGDHVHAHLVLDFGNKHPDQKYLSANPEKFDQIVLDQSSAINLGHINYTAHTIQLKTFGPKESRMLDVKDLRTFPFHTVFIGPDQQVVGFLSFSGAEGKGFAKDGYFYEVLQTEDWMYAMENNLFGDYGAALEAYLETIPDPEDPIIMEFKVAF
ncbi:6-bladed beta-propeller [Cyclobacterium xiamenense]|uniref:6-bladed beta-propeller n=1 Tax=Cyclobacterium xiamenense TaxID=1297121 RepID=UPI0012B6E77B|nr:6-bladed beta-propeller [Cyclobacterium xiamenense]